MYTVPQYIVEYQRELYRYLCQETKKKRKRKKEREREKTKKMIPRLQFKQIHRMQRTYYFKSNGLCHKLGRSKNNF